MGKPINYPQDVWKYINKLGEDDCWPWLGLSKDRGGHGMFTMQGKKVYGHRVVYELVHGRLSNSLEVMHLCGNSSCCNPKHLKEGTRSENVKQSYVDNPYMRESRLGSKNGRAKFTEDQVAAIRSEGGSHASLARKYSVNESTIARIRKGLRYA